MHFTRTWSLSCVLIVLMTPMLSAQTYTPDTPANLGIAPGATLHGGDIDSVNLFNGNVAIHIPLLSLPQRGHLSLNYLLQSNTPPYVFSSSTDAVTGDETQYVLLDPRAILTAPGIVRDSPYPNWNSIDVPNYGCGGDDGTYICDIQSFYWGTVTDGSGAVHNLLAERGTTNTFRAADGSGYMINGNLSGTPETLTESNGVKHQVAYTTSGSISQMTDQDLDGNQIVSLISHPNPTTLNPQDTYIAGVTDSNNRYIPTPPFTGAYTSVSPYPEVNLAGSTTAGCPTVSGASHQPLIGSTTWAVPGPNGTSASYLVCYALVTTNTKFYGGVVPNQNQYPGEVNASVPMIQSIVLPGAKGYWYFVYDSVDASDTVNPSYGTVMKVGLPTGGTISYTYAPQTPQEGACTLLPVATRTLNSGDGVTHKWTYQYNVTMPDGALATIASENDTLNANSTPTYTVVEYAGLPNSAGAYGLNPCSQQESQRRVYQGTYPNGTLLRTTKTRYQFSVMPKYSQVVFDYPLSVFPSQVTTIEAGGETTTTNYTYDSGFSASLRVKDSTTLTDIYIGTPVTAPFGKKIETTVENYDGTTAIDNLASYLFQGNSSYYLANLLDLPTSSIAKDGSGTILAKTTFSYDENNGSPQGVYGHLTSTNKWLNATGATATTKDVYYPEIAPTAGKISDVYDPNWNANSIATPGSHIQITYDSTGMFPQSVKQTWSNSSSATSSYTYDSNTGNLLSSKDWNGVVTQNIYSDPLGRLTLTKRAKGTSSEQWSSISYPSMNQTIIATDQTTMGDGLISSTAVTDGMGRVIHTTDPAGSIVDKTYDAFGNVLSVSNPHGTASAATDGITTYTYDALNRPIKQTDPGTGNATKQWCYDNVVVVNGQSCSPSASSLSGQWSDIYDETGTHTQQTADSLGRLIAVMEPDPVTNTLESETDYTYSALGNLLSVVQNGVSGSTPQTRNFTYDWLSRLITSSNPETGTICYGIWSGGAVGSGSCSGGYDPNGNLLYKTDARGVTTGYTYDALNRLITKSYSGGNSTIPMPPATTFTYDTVPGGIGRLASETTGSLSSPVTQTMIQVYDAMGRVKQEAMLAPNASSTILASYDLAGHQTSLTYPDGRTVTTGFDGAGRANSVSSLWPGAPSQQTYFSEANGYDAAGHLVSGLYGNGVPITASYDNRERVSLQTYGPTNAPLWSKQYGWTANSNLLSQTDLITGIQRQYGYDNLNRLTAAQDVFSTLAVPSGSNGQTGSTTTSGSAASQTQSLNGQIPLWTNPDDSNLLSEFNPANAAWLYNNAAITLNAFAAPDGTMTGALVSASQGTSNYNSGDTVNTYVASGISVPSNYSLETMTGSVWLRSVAGTQQVSLAIYQGTPQGYIQTNQQTFTATTSWQQFQVNAQLGDEVTSVALMVGGSGSVTSGQSFYLWNPMLEDEGEAGGSITNYLPYSQQPPISGTGWVGSNGASATQNTAAAPDGTQSATTVTIPAGSSNANMTQTVANPSEFGQQFVTASVYLKGPTSTSIVLAVWEIVGTNISVCNTSSAVTLTSSWQRFSVTCQTQSPLSTLGVGVTALGTTSAIQTFQMWGAQLELASSMHLYVPTGAAPATQSSGLTNLMSYSQNPTGSSWSAGTVQIAPNSVTAPDGSLTAAQVTGTSTDSILTNSVPNAGLYAGLTLAASVYLRSSNNGPQTVNLYGIFTTPAGAFYSVPIVCTLTQNWQRFSFQGPTPANMTGASLQIGGGNSVGAGQSYDVWGAQLEVASQPGPYIPTTALPIIAGGQPTNILSNSQAVTGPNWNFTNGTVTPGAAAAPDSTQTAATFAPTGTLNSISATVPNPSLYDNETVTASVYLRTVSGAQSVNLSLLNSGNQGAQTLQQSSLSLTSIWQRFAVTGTLQNGSTNIAMQISGASSPGIEVWGAQFAVGSDPAPYMNTGTTSAPSNSCTPHTTIFGSTVTTITCPPPQGAIVPYGLSQTYAYDSFGNILQNGSFNSTYTANNQMFGYAYDAAGNLLSNGLFSQMVWDAESRLASVGGATYIYDAEGNRVEKQGAGVTDTVYFGGQPVARYAGGAWTDLIYGPTGLLAEVPGTAAGQPSYRLTDNLGTDVGTLLANGTFVNAIDHTPFGQVISGATSDPYFFTGKERDAESGLDYFGARYYASSMGRWSSPDPSGLYYANPTNPQSFNLYAYVLNNPLKFLDMTGLDCVYLNSDGNGVENVDHHSTSGECGDNGGYWAPGYVNEKDSSAVQGYSNSDLLVIKSNDGGSDVTSISNCAGCSTSNGKGQLLGFSTETLGYPTEVTNPWRGGGFNLPLWVGPSGPSYWQKGGEFERKLQPWIDSGARAGCFVTPQTVIDTRDEMNMVQGKGRSKPSDNSDTGSPAVPFMPNNNRGSRNGYGPAATNGGDAAMNAAAAAAQYIPAAIQCAQGGS